MALKERKAHRPRRASCVQEMRTYMTPGEMTHMAFGEEAEFMRLVRESEIKMLLNYKGFDATREKFIILDSGR